MFEPLKEEPVSAGEREDNTKDKFLPPILLFFFFDRDQVERVRGERKKMFSLWIKEKEVSLTGSPIRFF
jgi:hypothetical protein